MQHIMSTINSIILLILGCLQRGNSVPTSVTEDFPTEILLISTEFFTENELSTELGNVWESRKFGEHMNLVYINEGCDLGDGYWTRDSLPRPVPAR